MVTGEVGVCQQGRPDPEARRLRGREDRVYRAGREQSDTQQPQDSFRMRFEKRIAIYADELGPGATNQEVGSFDKPAQPASNLSGRAK